MHVVLLLGSPYKKLEPWLETGTPVTKQKFYGSPFCFEQDSGEDGDARCSASLLWRWLGRCLEGEAVPDVVLLQEAVTDPKDRVRLFATLSDKTVGEVGALHLTRATLDSRVADATLPLLATFEEFAEALPSKAALDAIDLLQLPGFLSALRVEHLLRHQVAALLACVLLSISDERRRGWCRLIGFSIQTNMLEVAARLWDVHTTKSGCERG